MNTIDDISGFPREIKRTAKSGSGKKAASSVGKPNVTGAPNTSPLRTDKVEISISGQHLLNREAEVQRYRNGITDYRLLNPQAVTKLQEKIESGFYGKPEVLEEIVDTILTLPALQGAQVDGENEDSMKPDKGQLYEEIREKIRNKDYDQDEILDVIAQKVLDALF